MTVDMRNEFTPSSPSVQDPASRSPVPFWIAIATLALTGAIGVSGGRDAPVTDFGQTLGSPVHVTVLPDVV